MNSTKDRPGEEELVSLVVLINLCLIENNIVAMIEGALSMTSVFFSHSREEIYKWMLKILSRETTQGTPQKAGKFWIICTATPNSGLCIVSLHPPPRFGVPSVTLRQIFSTGWNKSFENCQHLVVYSGDQGRKSALGKEQRLASQTAHTAQPDFSEFRAVMQVLVERLMRVRVSFGRCSCFLAQILTFSKFFVRRNCLHSWPTDTCRKEFFVGKTNEFVVMAIVRYSESSHEVESKITGLVHVPHPTWVRSLVMQLPAVIVHLRPLQLHKQQCLQKLLLKITAKQFCEMNWRKGLLNAACRGTNLPVWWNKRIVAMKCYLEWIWLCWPEILCWIHHHKRSNLSPLLIAIKAALVPEPYFVIIPLLLRASVISARPRCIVWCQQTTDPVLNEKNMFGQGSRETFTCTLVNDQHKHASFVDGSQHLHCKRSHHQSNVAPVFGYKVWFVAPAIVGWKTFQERLFPSFEQKNGLGTHFVRTKYASR